jgi:hypothetical protein
MPDRFKDQNHSLGPTVYYTFGKDAAAAAEGDLKPDDDKQDEDAGQASQLTLGAGLQFGLTEATSDLALKLNGQLEF